MTNVILLTTKTLKQIVKDSVKRKSIFCLKNSFLAIIGQNHLVQSWKNFEYSVVCIWLLTCIFWYHYKLWNKVLFEIGTSNWFICKRAPNKNVIFASSCMIFFSNCFQWLHTKHWSIIKEFGTGGNSNKSQICSVLNCFIIIPWCYNMFSK